MVTRGQFFEALTEMLSRSSDIITDVVWHLDKLQSQTESNEYKGLIKGLEKATDIVDKVSERLYEKEVYK